MTTQSDEPEQGSINNEATSLHAENEKEIAGGEALGEPMVPDNGIETFGQTQAVSKTQAEEKQAEIRGQSPDDAPWSMWSSRDKKAIILTASFAAFFSPVSGQIYFPALNVISSDLGVSNDLINLTVTTYMIMQGLAPSFIGGLADDTGRRPAYMACFILYIIANIGLALQNNYAALLVLRMIQSSGSSGTVALANAVVADLVTSSERGIYIAWTSVAPMVGPVVGPIIGGLLSQYVNWHFIFWFLVIVAVVVFVPIALFFPETCRKIVGDGTIPPPKWNRCLTNAIVEKNAVQKGRNIQYEKRDELAAARKLRFPNPFNTFKLFFKRETSYVLICIGLICCGMYATVALIPSQFGAVYGFNELQISLCYIPFGVGTLAAAFIRGRVIDSRFRHHAKRLNISLEKNRRTDLTDFPIERSRLEVAVPTMISAALSLIGFAWCVQYKTNLAGPLIFLVLIGFSASASNNCINVLMIDLYPGSAGATTAAGNVVRCWLGAASTAFVVPMINAIGMGWTGTFFAFLMLAYTPVLFYVMKKGPQWRKETKERKEQKAREKLDIEKEPGK